METPSESYTIKTGDLRNAKLRLSYRMVPSIAEAAHIAAIRPSEAAGHWE